MLSGVENSWGYLGRESFSQSNSKIWRNKIYYRFNVILKLEFEVKNKYNIDGHQNSPLTTWGALTWGHLFGGGQK